MFTIFIYSSTYRYKIWEIKIFAILPPIFWVFYIILVYHTFISLNNIFVISFEKMLILMI